MLFTELARLVRRNKAAWEALWKTCVVPEAASKAIEARIGVKITKVPFWTSFTAQAMVPVEAIEKEIEPYLSPRPRWPDFDYGPEPDPPVDPPPPEGEQEQEWKELVSGMKAKLPTRSLAARPSSLRNLPREMNAIADYCIGLSERGTRQAAVGTVKQAPQPAFIPSSTPTPLTDLTNCVDDLTQCSTSILQGFRQLYLKSRRRRP